jgi:hypothetical protein
MFYAMWKYAEKKQSNFQLYLHSFRGPQSQCYMIYSKTSLRATL